MISINSFFRRGPAPLLGVDISSMSLKLVELRPGQGGAYTVQHCASEPLERGWMNDGNVEKFDEVAEALRRLVKKSGSRTKDVAMALSNSAVITKKIHLPGGLSEDMLEIEVESEAAQYIPFPLTEVNWDFCVMGPAPNRSDFVEVFLVATRREKVSDRQGLAEAAGLNLAVLDVESFASRLAASRVIESLPDRGRDMLIALFELGSQSSSLQVIRNEEMIYEREQSFGGAQLTEQMSRYYSWSIDEAESKKLSKSLPPDFDDKVLSPYLEGIGQDIGRALQFFFTSTSHNKLDCVLLAGGAAVWPGMGAAVAKHNSFPCKIVNPFDGMAFGPSLSSAHLAAEGVSYLVATGLAMRRFSV